MRKCNINNIEELFAAISEKASLYVPVDTAKTGAKFQKWERGTELSKALNTSSSAKDFFFPQSESLVDFKMEGKNIEIIDVRKESEDFVLFGVRACDVKSLDILDRVFLADTPDSYYASRREHCTVISLACTNPGYTCFCSTFGIDAAEPGADISAWMGVDALYLQANTEKGSALLARLESVTEAADAASAEGMKAVIRDKVSKLPLYDLKADAFGADKTKKFFDAPEWKSLAESCLGCGTCTFVCPTCQCYDIKDFDTGHGIKRFRCWDSCMYSDFTKMAHGNPRLTQVERFRQRFMHKLVYFPSNHDGMFSCVGCGRCISSCPVSMNIVKVMKELGGKEE